MSKNSDKIKAGVKGFFKPLGDPKVAAGILATSVGVSGGMTVLDGAEKLSSAKTDKQRIEAKSFMHSGEAVGAVGVAAGAVLLAREARRKKKKAEGTPDDGSPSR